MIKLNTHQEIVGVNSLIDRFLCKYSIFNILDKPGLLKNVCEEITTIANSCFSIVPQVDNDYIYDRIGTIKRYKQILDKLCKLPVVKQRSEEWYNMRKTLITASDFAQALGDGKFGTQKQLFVKKCGFEEDKFNNNAPALRWGVMFEPLASDIYSRRNFCKLYEFGLLRHPTVEYFGASPDGINECGVMLEIKCPFQRKITGEIPLQYFYQIQGQLDVCGLDECDYLECGFAMYEQEKDFWKDKGNYEKGIIIEYKMNESDETTQFKYSKLLLGAPDQDTDIKSWIEDQCNETPNIVNIHFWKIHTYNCSRIYRDNAFIQEKLGKMKDVWDTIELYKSNFDLYKEKVMTPTRAKRAASASISTGPVQVPDDIVQQPTIATITTSGMGIVTTSIAPQPQSTTAQKKTNNTNSFKMGAPVDYAFLDM